MHTYRFPASLFILCLTLNLGACTERNGDTGGIPPLDTDSDADVDADTDSDTDTEPPVTTDPVDRDGDRWCTPYGYDTNRSGVCESGADDLSAEGDCDDTNADVYPGAQEIDGDGLDNDCNGSVDADLDGDGYTEQAGDCDDLDPTVHPGATEYVDGIDDNCDGDTDPVSFCITGSEVEWYYWYQTYSGYNWESLCVENLPLASTAWQYVDLNGYSNLVTWNWVTVNESGAPLRNMGEAGVETITVWTQVASQEIDPFMVQIVVDAESTNGHLELWRIAEQIEESAGY